MTTITLPPLPHAELLALDPRVVGYVPAYTADQLRADRLAVAQAVIEACAAVCDSEWNGDADTYEASAAYNECADAIRAIKLTHND